ncbi:lipid hydroperoxide peroxidase [bacterium DOLJORAL78_65_58]|nr:MAG: lipid hydroperoxide peroxidase [bacterium DOLZORAL124_64_63]PIE75985.1 MAG: lipid hydroperoxide peroxidase [bacterium DOLJORAL78_65_58]
MAEFKLKGNPFNTIGNLPAVGADAPDVTLTGADLSDIKLGDYKGQKVVLNIFPSLDTAVCAASVRRFNEEASKLDNTIVVCVSMDLPFAMGRFCTTEGLENVVSASDFRNRAFAKEYGVLITDGPLKGLCARSVVVVNEEGDVVHAELCPETAEEPDYAAALAAL